MRRPRSSSWPERLDVAQRRLRLAAPLLPPRHVSPSGRGSSPQSSGGAGVQEHDPLSVGKDEDVRSLVFSTVVAVLATACGADSTEGTRTGAEPPACRSGRG